MKPASTLLLAFFAVCLPLCLVLAPLHAPRAAPPLPLLCLFDVSQHEPEFLAVFDNNTGHTVDIFQMYTRSSITLDGKNYPYQPRGITFIGNSSYAAGRQWPYPLALSEYMPGWTQRPDAEGGQGTRWHSLLPSGMHTLTLHMGGKTYGPALFFWDEDRPYVFRSDMNLAPPPATH